ncbi:hypothetical protein F66182_1628 [Fusarium sp. NRRL 66182]|nr:hypothetical protein F66182_1628 [Fusarium sp. NRRL 66182]
MSHTGPASCNASRRSSRSPQGDEQVSPSSIRHGHLDDRDFRHVSNVQYTNGEDRMQQIPQKTLGVHNILNPLEPRLQVSGGNGPLPPAARHSDAPIHSPFPGARPFPAGQPASISLPGTPIGPMTPLGGPSSERGSPTTAFPFPAVNNTRPKASPTQHPRAISMSHGPPSRDLDARMPSSLLGASPAKRPFEEMTPDDTRSQYPSLHPVSGIPTGPPSSMSDLGRSLSQAAMTSPGTQAPLSALPPNNAPGRHQPPPLHPQTPYHPNMQAGRPFPSPGPSETASPWSETIRRHGMGGSLFGVEGQQAYMTLPGSETPIPVHMDFSQASKKADEKRQRNAVASTRHRRKKKIMQEENSKQLQELREERRLMEIRIEELMQQRDFYREDRNRLRDIVAQTPSISGLAVGPPSPTFSTSNSYADTGSMASGPPGSMGYGGDSLSSERPTQRRRTDDHPEYSLPPYGSPASGHPSASPSGLPSMPIPGYHAPSRPSSAASSVNSERLPPLRVMEGRPPGPPPGSGQVQEQDPRTGQWVSVQPRVTESGWATRDTHRRH